LTALAGISIVSLNGKDLLVCQRAKVGKVKLADFFVPLMGLPFRTKIYERRFFSGPGILGKREGHQP
jgi:hypothetical protein